MRRNVTEEAQDPRLVTPFPVGTGELDRLLGEGQRLPQTAGQQGGFAQRSDPERLSALYAYRDGLLDRLLQEWQGFGAPPGQGIRCTQVRGRPGKEISEVPTLAERHTIFERGDGLLDVAFVEVQQADTPIRKDKARWVCDYLGNADPFVAAGDPLGKFA